jgi:hypothetical protein
MTGKRKKLTGGFCVAMLAMLVTLATFGGTASGTRLCNQEGSGEKCLGKIYMTKTAWEAPLAATAKSVLQEGYETVECSKSTLKGTTTSEGGGLATWVLLNVESATWASCTCGKMEVTAGSLPWSFGIRGTGNKDGEFIGTYNLKTECSNETCLFQPGLISPMRGGTNGRIEISSNLVPLKGSGAKCANPSKWTATYDFTAPTPLFVTKE